MVLLVIFTHRGPTNLSGFPIVYIGRIKANYRLPHYRYRHIWCSFKLSIRMDLSDRYERNLRH